MSSADNMRAPVYESEEYRRAIDFSPDCFFVIDLEGHILYCNPATEYITGYKPEEFLYKHFTENVALDQEEMDGFKNLFEKLIREEHLDPFELQIIKKGGEKCWVESRAVILKDEKGPCSIQMVTRDIHEKKLAETSLRESEEKYRFLYDNSYSINVIIDQDGIIMDVNKAAVKMFGVPKSAVRGRSVFEYIVPEQQDEALHILQEHLKGMETPVIELHLDLASGQRTVILEDGSVHSFKEGNKTRMLVSALDITDNLRFKDEKDFRLQAEKLISRISAGFINLPDTETDAAIVDALGQISELIGAERCNLFLRTEDDRYFSNTHEWSKGPKDSQLEIFQMIPVETFAFTAGLLEDRQNLVFGKPSDIPDEATDLKEWFGKDGFRPVYFVPVVSGNIVTGTIGLYGAFNEEKDWPEELDSLLSMLANVLLSAKERKKINRLLRLSQFAIENSKQATYLINKDARIVSANPAVTELTGYSLDELIGMRIVDLDPDYPLEQFFGLFELLRKEKNITFQSRVLRKDKKQFPIEINISYINFEGEDFLIGFVQDITERLRVADEIKKSEEQYRRIFENIIDVFYEAGMDGNLINVTPSIETLSSYTREELIGKPMTIFYADTTEREKFLNLLKKQGYIKNHYLKLKDKDGSIRYCMVSSKIINNDEGKPDRIVGSLSDISDRIDAESRIRQLSSAVEQSPISIIILNNKGLIDYVNPNFQNVIGYNSEQLLGRALFSIDELDLNEDDFKAMYEILTEKHIWRGEIKYLKNKKVESWAQLTLSTITDNTGELTHFVGIGEDVTRRKLYEEELKLAKRKAEESDKLKSSFLANMSHEIRTPMNAILGFSSLLKEESLKDEQRNYYIDIINNKGKDLIRIISDIIDISRIEAGDLEMKIEPVHVYEFIKDIYTEYKSDAVISTRNGLRFRLNLPEKRKVVVNTDPVRLKQVLINLIQNAIKFTSDGYIEIGFSFTPDNKIRFFVKDSGIGIPKDKQALIFDRFRQVDDSHTREYGGTGLGLSISENLVTRLGGTLSLVSEPGQGSEFYFDLDFISGESVPEKQASEKEHPVSAGELNLNGKRILIVEDDSSSYLYLDSILNKTQPEIVWAKNGKQAVDIFRSGNNFDMVLMDIRMPEMNGFDATRIIREIDEKVPIIAQTAYAQVADRKIALESGCNDYLSKPIKAGELVKMLGRYFHG